MDKVISIGIQNLEDKKLDMKKTLKKEPLIWLFDHDYNTHSYIP